MSACLFASSVAADAGITDVQHRACLCIKPLDAVREVRLARKQSPAMNYPDHLSELFDNPFHGAALTAFVEQAAIQQSSSPCPIATRQRAYQLYEAELAARKR
jgi:hypothetical protein